MEYHANGQWWCVTACDMRQALYFFAFYTLEYLHIYIRRYARSLQKVQGHRTAQGHRAGVDVDVTPLTGGPVGHPPNPATLCDRSTQESKS